MMCMGNIATLIYESLIPQGRRQVCVNPQVPILLIAMHTFADENNPCVKLGQCEPHDGTSSLI